MDKSIVSPFLTHGVYVDIQMQNIYHANTSQVIYDVIYNIFQPICSVSGIQFLYQKSILVYYQQLYQDTNK